MYKNIKYILLFVLCFCMFSLNAKAVVYMPEGECLYNFNNDVFDEYKDSFDGGMSIKIVQEINKYHYEYKVGNNDWVKLKNGDNSFNLEYKNSNGSYGYFTYFLSNVKDANFFGNDGGYSSCPKYAIFYNYSDYNIGFYSSSNDNTIDNKIVVSVDKNSSIKNSTNPYYYVNGKCPSNSTVSESGDNDFWIKTPDNPKKDNGYCLYMRYNEDFGCFFLELNYTNSKITSYVNDSSSYLSSFFGNQSVQSNLKFIYGADLKDEMLKNGCPPLVAVGISPFDGFHFGVFNLGTIGGVSENYTEPVSGLKFGGLKTMSLAKSNPASTNTILPTERMVDKYENCKELIGDKMSDLLKNVVKVLRILIPIILNVFGIIDFAKAIFAGKEDEMRKAQLKFIKRLIIGVVIYLIPSLLKLVLNIAHGIWPVVDNTVCGILD